MNTPLEWIADIAPTIDADNSTDKKNRFITIAQNEVDSKLFSDSNNYNLAIAYYTCHLLNLTSQSGEVTGQLIKEKEGDLMKEYSSPSNNSNIDSNSSQYLVMYEKLLKARVPNFYMNRGN